MIGIRRILVPVDLSTAGRIAVDYGAWLGERLGATLEVVNVIRAPTATMTTGEYRDDLAHHGGDEQLDELRRAVDARSGTPTRVERVSANICESILRRVSAGRHDLVILAVRQPTHIADLIWWHVSEMVVRLAPCPVLTLHGNEQRDVDDESRAPPAESVTRGASTPNGARAR